jgi:hypothetical protein
MRKLIRLMPVLAILFAIGSAFTTKSFTATNGYSRLVDFPSQAPTSCLIRTTGCDTQGSLPCTFQGVHLYDITCTVQQNKLQ